MIDTPYLDKALARINERITVERLSKEVPAIGRMRDSNEAMVNIMGRAAAIVGKHQITILTDDETGLTVDGYDPKHAADELTATFSLVRMTSVRHQ